MENASALAILTWLSKKANLAARNHFAQGIGVARSETRLPLATKAAKNGHVPICMRILKGNLLGGNLLEGNLLRGLLEGNHQKGLLPEGPLPKGLIGNLPRGLWKNHTTVPRKGPRSAKVGVGEATSLFLAKRLTQRGLAEKFVADYFVIKWDFCELLFRSYRREGGGAWSRMRRVRCGAVKGQTMITAVYVCYQRTWRWKISVQRKTPNAWQKIIETIII